MYKYNIIIHQKESQTHLYTTVKAVHSLSIRYIIQRKMTDDTNDKEGTL